MKRGALLIAALFVSFGAASAAPKYFGASPSLAVRAGVGGAARPGRWLPVDVAVTAGDAAFHGEVVAQWGGAIARRDVDLAASASARVTLMLRTIAATPAIHTSLISTGDLVAASSETPLTLLRVDDPVTLCIGEARPDSNCSVKIPAIEAPRDWRGFDVADEVIWNSSAPRPADAADAAAAYSLWQAVRWWQDSGFVDPVVAPFDLSSRLLDRTSANLTGFVAVLVLASALVGLRRAPLMLIVGVPIAVAAGGAALVARSSRDVDIQASSFVHQFAGVPRAIVLMKGDVEHPGPQTLELVPGVDAASVDIVRGLQQTESTASADDRAVYRNAAGRGVKQRFELNGSLGAEWLGVTQHDGDISVTNRSGFALTDCQVRSGEPVSLGSIAPGATAHGALSQPLASGDAVVCGLPPGWLKWAAPGATVATRGTSFLIFHAWPGPAAIPAEPRASR